MCINQESTRCWLRPCHRKSLTPKNSLK